MNRSRSRRIALSAPVLAVTLALAACGGGVEFNGPVFSAMGLGDKAQKTQPSEVPTRAPLVIPPKTSLPPPSSQQQTAMAPPDWPNDPQVQEKEAKEQDEARKKEYYDKGDWSGDRKIGEFDKLIDRTSRQPGLLGRDTVPDNYQGSSAEGSTTGN